MKVRAHLKAGAVAIAAAGIAAAVSAAPASAQPQVQGTLLRGEVTAAATCPYPYVCFIKNGSIIGRFKDVTSTWQPLPSKPSAPLTVVNTRHDDVAYIRWVNGATACLPPESAFDVTGGQLNAVRISSSSTC
ncbi:hypothetical protein [Streptomyces thermoalcalitolerans]|uniref:Peptidase inhibitor family I36 n=1 Tax=Streptomyces thermoalcalitolerans TaxID=65605 RepID=A0ABN1P3Q5_9ACTN